MAKQIRYTEKAAKQLRRIFRSDKKSACMIVTALEEYSANRRARYDIKILKGQFEDLKRLRIGNYRIIFDEDMMVINIYEIKHRQEAYHD